MKYLKMSTDAMTTGDALIVPRAALADILDAEIDSAEPGNKIVLEVVEMSEEEYGRLAESRE